MMQSLNVQSYFNVLISRDRFICMNAGFSFYLKCPRHGHGATVVILGPWEARTLQDQHPKPSWDAPRLLRQQRAPTFGYRAEPKSIYVRVGWILLMLIWVYLSKLQGYDGSLAGYIHNCRHPSSHVLIWGRILPCATWAKFFRVVWISGRIFWFTQDYLKNIFEYIFEYIFEFLASAFLKNYK